MSAPWMKIGPLERGEPGPGLTVTVTIELKSPWQVLTFAWDMAREVTVFRWWHRLAVFFGLCVFGFGRLTSRSAP